MARAILILLVLTAALTAPDDLSSCGPFFPQAVFAPRSIPLDEASYLSGKLGIVQPNYQRIYLMAAYRYFTGLGLTAADQAALINKPAAPDFWSYQNAALQQWLHARTLVGAPPLDHVDRFKFYGPGAYIVNCGDGAFAHAAETLSAHFTAGYDHDDLRAWVAAQDQVFANCGPSGNASADIPDAAPPNAPPWMRADRAYQIAAAEFYGGAFDDAAKAFQAIAADRKSPWHGMGHYLAARAYIRKLTLAEDPSAAPAARAELQKAMDDPDGSAWRDAARSLLTYLLIQTDPAAALDAAARIVETARSGVAQSMTDYHLLLDHFDNHAQNAPPDQDITDWLAAMQHDSGEHSLQRWRETRALPWLVAALTWADHAETDMIGAASQVPERSPAYLTVQFHRLRLLPAEEARPQLERLLREKTGRSAHNLFLAERMHVAQDWNDLLRYAPRVTVGTFQVGPQPNIQPAPATRYFDDDGARILDRQAPLTVLRDAARSQLLPENLQAELARVVWVRAVTLGNTAIARDIAPDLARHAPFLKPYLDAYLAAAGADAQNFEATWLLLNNPGMNPWVEAGLARPTPVPKIDNFRNNWWCPEPAQLEPVNAALRMLYGREEPQAAFLTPGAPLPPQIPVAPTFLARRTVEWAVAHPNDPRAPEALHLAVRATHFACADDAETGRWSQRAFQLLHSRYANTAAAAATPYWYGQPVR